MQTTIIDISNDNRELSARRGFLCIKEHGEMLGEIPLDSICAIMATGRAILYTQNLLRELCEHGIPLVIVGDNFHPVGMMLPSVGQVRQMAVQQMQIAASKPLAKQLWAEIVREKIRNQSRVLDLFERDNRIKHMPSMVASGDTGNLEAIAAKMYFPSLFKPGFIRNVPVKGINSFLNYGYAVVRAACARLVVAAGLNPSFGIQHHNQLNPFCLVDDLMEPYRPLVDMEVYKLFDGADDETRELLPEDKKKLTAILDLELRNKERGFSPLIQIMQNDVWAFVHSLEEKKNKLDYVNVIQD
jgi:CRISPR-associated protein Cas1